MGGRFLGGRRRRWGVSHRWFAAAPRDRNCIIGFSLSVRFVLSRSALSISSLSGPLHGSVNGLLNGLLIALAGTRTSRRRTRHLHAKPGGVADPSAARPLRRVNPTGVQATGG